MVVLLCCRGMTSLYPSSLTHQKSSGGLTARAEWIRTFSSALDRRRFRGFVPVGTDLPAHRSLEQLPASAYLSGCRAAVRGAAAHRPDQAASHHGSAVGGASASRNRGFESAFLQRGVCKLSVPRGQRFLPGAPGPRPIYGPDYYAAFIIYPDGYRIEAYYGPAETAES